MTTTATKNKTKSKTTTTPKQKFVLSNAAETLINTHLALPSTIVKDLIQRKYRRSVTQESVSATLRKLHLNGRIGRLANGVFCQKGINTH